MEETFKVSIPTDPDGFVLFKCPLCAGFFKMTPSDAQADDVLELWCPSCGFKSANYLIDEALDLGLKKAKNEVNKMLQDFSKKMEKHSSKFVKITSDFKPEYEHENPIVSKIDSLVVQHYDCCDRDAKIEPSVKFSGSYCPFCGVYYDSK